MIFLSHFLDKLFACKVGRQNKEARAFTENINNALSSQIHLIDGDEEWQQQPDAQFEHNESLYITFCLEPTTQVKVTPSEALPIASIVLRHLTNLSAGCTRHEMTNLAHRNIAFLPQQKEPGPPEHHSISHSAAHFQSCH